MIEKIKKILDDYESIDKKRGAMSRFAEKIGAGKNLVWMWLNNRAKPGIDYQQKIIKVYNLPADYFGQSDATGPPIVKRLSKEELWELVGQLREKVTAAERERDRFKDEKKTLEIDLKKIYASIDEIRRTIGGSVRCLYYAPTKTQK